MLCLVPAMLSCLHARSLCIAVLTLPAICVKCAVRHEAFQYENGQMKFVDLPTAGVQGEAACMRS